MEEKVIWLIAFAVAILAMNLCSMQAGKHHIKNVEEEVKLIPKWKAWLYGLLQHQPYYLLNSKGKKWQTVVYILLVPTVFIGYKLGQFVNQ